MEQIVRVGVFVSLLAAAACGGGNSSSVTPSPVPSPSPAPTLSLAGTWTGRMTFTYQGKPDQWLDTRVEFTQPNASTLTGTWRVTAPADNDVSGEIAGTLDGSGINTQFHGAVTLRNPGQTPGVICTAHATFEGRVTPTMRWTSPQFPFDPSCTDLGLTDLVWTLTLSQ